MIVYLILLAVYLFLIIVHWKECIVCYKRIPRTIKHYLAFMRIQKQLTGKYKYKFHDLDKLFMYMIIPFEGMKTIRSIHRDCRHHITSSKKPIDVNYEEAVIDWECSRYTKPEKQLTAREFYEQEGYRLGVQHKKGILLALKKLKL